MCKGQEGKWLWWARQSPGYPSPTVCWFRLFFLYRSLARPGPPGENLQGTNLKSLLQIIFLQLSGSWGYQPATLQLLVPPVLYLALSPVPRRWQHCSTHKSPSCTQVCVWGVFVTSAPLQLQGVPDQEGSCGDSRGGGIGTWLQPYPFIPEGGERPRPALLPQVPSASWGRLPLNEPPCAQPPG